MDELSGFIDDRNAVGDMIYIPISQNSTFRIGRMIRHGRWAVVKSTHPDFDTELGRIVLEKEFNLLSQLNHPSIVRVIDFCQIGELGWSIVMEWIDGDTLDSAIAGRNIDKSVRHAIARDIINAIAYMHCKGLTHRDLKPSNILLDHNNNPHIIDFGLADDSTSALIKQVSGTRGYVAPEVSMGLEDIDWWRADVYALGLILQLLDAGYSYNSLARRCLKENPQLRPADGDNVIAHLRHARLKRLCFGITAILIAIFVMLWSFIPDTPQNPKPIPIQSQHSKPASVVDTSISALELPMVDQSAEPLRQDKKEETHQEKTPQQPVDINFVILRAMNLRDSLIYANNGTDYHSLIPQINHLTDSLLDRGIQFGLTPDEAEFFKRTVHTDAFYQRGSIQFMPF